MADNTNSACSNRLSSLKFVGDALSVSALIGLVILNFNLLTSNLDGVIARGVVNFPTNFGVSGTFRSRLIGQQLSDAPRDIATLTFDLEITSRVTRMMGFSILPIMGFLCLAIFELDRGTLQTDGRTDTRAHFRMPPYGSGA